MTFVEKVKNTEDLKDCLKPGLQALTEQYKNKIKAKKPRKINGSIFLEECLSGGTWDYIIGYNDETFFVEIHPAETSEVNTVLNKLRWLKEWKRETSFNEDNNFYWLSSNGVHILPRSPYWKRIHSYGLKVQKYLFLK
jgi:hypothetical protein